MYRDSRVSPTGQRGLTPARYTRPRARPSPARHAVEHVVAEGEAGLLGQLLGTAGRQVHGELQQGGQVDGVRERTAWVGSQEAAGSGRALERWQRRLAAPVGSGVGSAASSAPPEFQYQSSMRLVVQQQGARLAGGDAPGAPAHRGGTAARPACPLYFWCHYLAQTGYRCSAELSISDVQSWFKPKYLD